MSTVRDVISNVRATNRLLSSDNVINDRTVAAQLKNKATFLINQKTNLRRFWNTDTIFTTIPCLEMKNVPLAECCDYTSDREISRSKYKIPRVSEGNYQYLVQYVGNVEGGNSFDYMPVKRYENKIKLNLSTRDTYYWIHNDYLYMTISDIQVVRITARFEEDIPENLLYPDCKCADRKEKNPCQNPLDLEFKCPGNLQDTVVNMTSEYLLKTYFRVPEDKTSDQKDDTTINKV